jgi:hypothetical protein
MSDELEKGDRDARQVEPLSGLVDHGPVPPVAEAERPDVAVVSGVRPSWDEWIEDHDRAWPADSGE